jgi:chaperone required for assembly of F1-ATPase
MADQPAPRRSLIYTSVTVEATEGGFGVRLDGRSARAPGGSTLTLPSKALAQLVADEWAAQGETIDTTRMPATRLAFTALDRVPPARAEVAAEVARYAGSDLLCYLEEENRALAEREAAAWGPWLGWAADSLSVKLTPAFGVSPAVQSSDAIARVQFLAEALDDFSLTGLVYAAGLYGSAVLAFAVQQGALRGEDAFELSRLDEAFQEERWGVDEEARARTEAMRDDARMVDRWFAALR